VCVCVCVCVFDRAQRGSRGRHSAAPAPMREESRAAAGVTMRGRGDGGQVGQVDPAWWWRALVAAWRADGRRRGARRLGDR
jgi:hypothetical protein